MIVEPNLKEWASKLAIIARNGFGNKEIEQLENDLKEIAAKYRAIGYEEGLNKGWALEQDKEYAQQKGEKLLAEHVLKGNLKCSF